MCGIAGVVSFAGSNFHVTEDYLSAMSDVMVHRGPDGDGLWIEPGGRVGFAHRRLAIIDLSDRAAQPMMNSDGSLCLVFNGEIYNHHELRVELDRGGRATWKTDHSDTEVILHAYERWGIDCVFHFRGMFAFALWDATQNELWLVRDRIGVKPLYYSVHHGRLAFASEIKALLKDPQQSREVDEQAFFHYLSFLTTPAPDTLFRGIKKLPGGSRIRVSPDGSIRTDRYWDPWDQTKPLTKVPEAEINERVLHELRTSVRYRKVSDVPVGIFLSGGLDSSTNAILFSEGETNPIKTFTIGYQGDFDSYRNELGYARSIADRTGADHHELLLTLDDFLDFIPRMVSLQDEPIADPVCFPVYFVSKLARDNGVVVCQVGEGADELFCGYPSWRDAIHAQRIFDTLPRSVTALATAFLPLIGKGTGRRFESVRRAGGGQPIFWGGAEAFTDAEKRLLLSPRLRQLFRGTTSWDPLAPIHARFLERAWEPSTLNWMTYLDLSLRLPELLLMRVDKMSMGTSLECRVPFLDHNLVELALAIPTEMKIRNGELKRVLKNSVEGLVPAEVVHRRKQGFGVPIHGYFHERLGDFARKELHDFADRSDFLDPKGIAQWLDSDAGPQVWYLLNFALWWKTYIS